MSDFENQKTINGNIYHCEAGCSLESKENENPSDPDFFALIPRKPSYTELPGGAEGEQEPSVDTSERITELQKAFLSAFPFTFSSSSKYEEQLMNKIDFLLSRDIRRFPRGIEPGNSLLQLLADQSALFYDYDFASRDNLLNKDWFKVSKKRVWDSDAAMDAFSKAWMKMTGENAEKSGAIRAAEVLFDRISAKHKGKNRSLFQWLYANEHLVGIRSRENRKLRSDLIQRRIKLRLRDVPQWVREEKRINYTHILSDKKLARSYRQLLEGCDSTIKAFAKNAAFRSVFLNTILIPCIHGDYERKLIKVYPPKVCDPTAHDVTGMQQRLARLESLFAAAEQCASRTATAMDPEHFEWPESYPPKDLPHTTSAPSDMATPIALRLIAFFRSVGVTSASPRRTEYLCGYIRWLFSLFSKEEIPIRIIALLGIYKHKLMLRPFELWDIDLKECPYVRKAYFPGKTLKSEQRLAFLRLIKDLCCCLGLSSSETADALNQFLYLYGTRWESPAEVRLWSEFAAQCGYERIPQMGVQLKAYQYGITCLPPCDHDLARRSVRAIPYETYLRFLYGNVDALLALYQEVKPDIEAYESSYKNLWTGRGVSSRERYLTFLADLKTGTGISALYEKVDLNQFILPDVCRFEGRTDQHITNTVPLETKNKRIRENRQELQLMVCEVLMRLHLREKTLKALFKAVDKAHDLDLSVLTEFENFSRVVFL